MSEWQNITLAELTINHDGKRRPVKESDRKPGPYPYYGASGIVDYVDSYIFDGEYLLIAEDGENLRSCQTPIAFMARGKFWVNNHAHIVTGNTRADTRFLMYALQNANIDAYLSGAVMPKLTQGNLNRIQINCPLLPEQRAIAHILGSLDDKIELNRQMNDTLEAMARALFTHWFVDFGPVRAKMEGRQPPGLAADIAALFPDALDAEGKPQGWEIQPLGNYIDVFDSQRVPLSGRERAKRQGVFPYYGATNIMDFIDDYLFEGIYVLLGEDGSVVKETGTPYTQYVWGKFWVNNHAHVLRGRGISTEMLLCFLNQCNVVPFVTGAVQMKLNQGNLKSIPFLDSGNAIANSFSKVISPFFTRMRANTDESRTLAALRDLLLPKLLSGEIRIRDAEQVLEEVL